jgi:hypothetical protein
MNIKSRLKKLDGHAQNLLSFYLGTCRKYAMVVPALFDQGVGHMAGVGFVECCRVVGRSPFRHAQVSQLVPD